MSQALPENYGQGDYVAEDSVTESTAGTVEATETSEMNPIWEKALESIPNEFHSFLTPTFKNWDDNYAKDKAELANYKQYTPLLEHKVPFQDIESALELSQLIQTRPRDVYDYLQKQFNFSPEEAAAVIKEQEEEVFDLSAEGKYDIQKDPAFQQVSNELKTMQQYAAQQQNAVTQAQMRTQVDSEITQIKQQFPMLEISDVARYATGMSATSGEMPNLIEAAQAMAKYLPKERESDGAPPIMSGGNRGLPSEKPDFGKMTSEERTAFVAQAMAAANKE